MQTTITAKFQTTIPKKIREQLKLAVNDSIEWRIEGEKIILKPLHGGFMLRKNSIKTGPGDIEADIVLARKLRAVRE